MRLKLVPSETKINFFTLTKLTAGLSALLAVLSMVAFFVFGLNYGIDFRGGSVIRTATPAPVEVSEYRAVLRGLELGDFSVTAVVDPGAELTDTERNSVMIRIEQASDNPEIQNDLIAEVKSALNSEIDGIIYLQTDSVGAKVSGELVVAGIEAVVLAVLAVLFYIWLRFEWQFSLGAVAALVHDVILTIGVFAVLQIEFNLSIIAAILTIVGYSLNDTVVVFDRVRENLRRFKAKPLKDVLNLSINETLSRTVMTSVTTLLALGALYVLGGDVIRGFTFAMIWGVLVGTYSSVFVASPILLRLGVKRDWDKDNGAAGTQYANIDA
ncbi:MAG: protein translocase subunit SecF [Rhodobacteraceae bacterium]|nr:protein translocase subunit SecF [Paracoccaceae bacterium]